MDKFSQIWVRGADYDGSPHWVHPARLVQHESGIVVTETSIGCLVETTRGPWASSFHTRGHYWPERWYNVIRLHDDVVGERGRLSGFYCNIATPVEFDGADLRYVDLQLDVRAYVEPDGGLRHELLDEDEFAAARERFGYPAELVERCYSAVDDLVRLIEARVFPFDI